MLMPIVSMNKMAMNESVAATCCYAERVSATNVYWEVLHGGWIGSGYVTTRFARVNNADRWADLYTGNDVSFDYDDFPTITRVTGIIPGVPSWEFDTITDGTTGPYDNMLGWIYDSNTSASFIRTCDHKQRDNCAYYAWEAEWTPNRHWEASSKHDTGTDDWADPHGARQWAS